MADDPKNNDGGQNPEGGQTPEGGDDSEKKFWTKMDDRIDAGIERALKKHIPNEGSRTGRTSLPSVLADLLFGKQG